MYLHNWMPTLFEANVLFQGKHAQIHHVKCRNCGKLVICLDTELPEHDGCSNAHPPKEKWKAPIKEKEVETKTYPAKKRRK
jgi:hypothetical protein